MGVIEGIICHKMLLVARIPELVRGRPPLVYVNLLGHIRNMGAIYVGQDIVVDGDRVTGHTGGHCYPFAHKIIELLLTEEQTVK